VTYVTPAPLLSNGVASNFLLFSLGRHVRGSVWFYRHRAGRRSTVVSAVCLRLDRRVHVSEARWTVGVSGAVFFLAIGDFTLSRTRVLDSACFVTLVCKAKGETDVFFVSHIDSSFCSAPDFGNSRTKSRNCFALAPSMLEEY